MHGDGRGSDGPPPIPARRIPLRAPVVLAALLTAGTVSAGSRCPKGPATTIPLVPGATWVYAGDVQSTVMKKDRSHVLKRHVTPRMEVQAAFRRGNTTAALVKGYPDELAWYEPEQPRQTYLFFQRDDGTLTRVSADLEACLRHWQDTGYVPDEAPEIAAPLRVGKTWGGEEEVGTRADKWYQWHVERVRCVALRGVRGADGRRLRSEYLLGYRTCPDQQVVYWSPGLGITRFVYSHHGTVAEADVRLIAFQPGRGLRARPRRAPGAVPPRGTEGGPERPLPVWERAEVQEVPRGCGPVVTIMLGRDGQGGGRAFGSGMSAAEASMREAQAIVRRVVGSLPVRVFLFGSRALGTSRPTSDIDLALLPEGRVPTDLVARLRDEFEESSIPYTVDVVDLAQVDERFREKVLREGHEWAA